MKSITDRPVKKIRSRSPEETMKIGREIACSLAVPGIVLLRGELGMGKTTLTRGIAQGLGMEDPGLVHSPSFSLVNVYRGTCPIYHVDLYRCGGARDLYSVGLDDFMGNDGVTVVEWSERLSGEVKDAVQIEIEDAGEESRIIHVSVPSKRHKKRS